MADTLQRSDYLGIINQGRASSSSFALSAAQLQQRQLEFEANEAERLRIDKDRDRQLDISEYQTRVINQGQLDINKAQQLLNAREQENKDAAEARADSTFVNAENRKNFTGQTNDLRQRIEDMADAARDAGDEDIARIYNDWLMQLKDGSKDGQDIDYIRMAAHVYGEEGVADWLNQIGGSSLLEDWTRKGERAGEEKSFSDLAFNFDSGQATARVTTPRGAHPLTEGGQNLGDGGTPYEDGQFPIASLNRMINVLESQYGDQEAQALQRLQRETPTNETVSLRELIANGKIDVTKLSRSEKEQLGQDDMPLDQQMSNELAEQVYGALYVDEEEVDSGATPYTMTSSGIQATSGIDLSGGEANDVVEASFGTANYFEGLNVFRGTKQLRPTDSTAAIMAGKKIVEDNKKTYQNYTHDPLTPFSLTSEDQKNLPQNMIKARIAQSNIIATASAGIAIDELVYAGDKVSFGYSNEPRTDIGTMIDGLISGEYVENDRIDGELYSKKHAEMVKDFYTGSGSRKERNRIRQALVRKLATDVDYRTQFMSQGAMQFALSHSSNEDLFKEVDTKTHTKTKVDIVQMKNYLKKEYGIEIPSGPDLTEADFEDFRDALLITGIPTEKLNEMDNTIAGIIQLGNDKETGQIDLWWDESESYRVFAGLMGYASIPEAQKTDAMRQNFMNLAITGRGTSQLQRDSDYVNNLIRLTEARAKLQSADSALRTTQLKTHAGMMEEVRENNSVVLDYFLGATEPFGSKKRQRREKEDFGSMASKLKQSATIGKEVKMTFGVASPEYAAFSRTMDPAYEEVIKQWANDNKDDLWFGWLRGIDAPASITNLTPRMVIENLKGTERLTKISQLMRRGKGGEIIGFDETLAGNMEVQDPVGRAIGASNSFYKFISTYGQEAGIHVLSRFVGLEDDITPR